MYHYCSGPKSLLCASQAECSRLTIYLFCFFNLFSPSNPYPYSCVICDKAWFTQTSLKSILSLYMSMILCSETLVVVKPQCQICYMRACFSSFILRCQTTGSAWSARDAAPPGHTRSGWLLESGQNHGTSRNSRERVYPERSCDV
jgi:hypothetical protein